jgi:hypothetical protein
MKRLFFLFSIVSLSFVASAQEVPSDSTTVNISFADNIVKVNGISAQTFDVNDVNAFGMRVNRKLYWNFMIDFKISTSTTVHVVMRKLKFLNPKLEPQKFGFLKVAGYNSDDLFSKSDVDKDWWNYFYVTFEKNNSNGLPNFPKKLKKSYISITSVDKIQRTISGEISLDCETTDGTPIKVKGTFTNLSYDGGYVTNPLYQRG